MASQNINHINVAIIEPVGGHGGMNYYDFGLAEGLSLSNCNVIVYTSEQTGVPKKNTFEVKITFKGIWGKAPKFVRGIRFIYCLFTSLIDAKAKHVSIIHYHFFHYTFMEALCVKLARVFSFKVVATIHDVESFSGKYNIDKASNIISSVDKVIAHNEVSKQALITMISLPPAAISVVPHGNYIDTIDVVPTKNIARKKIGLSNEDKVILFFGQIKKVKGLDTLLLSLSDVIKQYPRLKLVIAGKVWKDDFNVYEKIIYENNLSQNILSHIRYINDNDVPNYYSAADLVILPYRKIYQSGVLLMAMSYTVPVLVSDIPGMIEIITDGENGYVYQSESITSLSLKIIKVLSDPKELERIGQAGYNTVSTEFNWSLIGRLTVEVYKALGSEE